MLLLVLLWCWSCCFINGTAADVSDSNCYAGRAEGTVGTSVSSDGTSQQQNFVCELVLFVGRAMQIFQPSRVALAATVSSPSLLTLSIVHYCQPSSGIITATMI